MWSKCKKPPNSSKYKGVMVLNSSFAEKLLSHGVASVVGITLRCYYCAC